jgi:GNAT superfamily N-acetyltransferase
MEKVSVRQALKSDLGKLLKFEQAIIEVERPLDPTIRRGDGVRYYDLNDLITSPAAMVVVAECGSEVIGSGYARVENAKPYRSYRKYTYLGFMYVVPEYRGKGINRSILQALEAWSVSQGVTEMRLEVYAENAGAIKAYEKAGFRPTVVEMRKNVNNGNRCAGQS